MSMGTRALAALLAAGLAACGGSGSTGLVSPEGALLQQARNEGTCVTSTEMVTYCATDSPQAVSPDGASASGPLPRPVATTTAGGPAPTPTFAGSASPTAATSATPGIS